MLFFGNFLPFFGNNSHYLLGIEFGLLLLDNLPTLLREEQVRAQWFSRRLHVLADLLLFFFDISFDEVTVQIIPDLALDTLLERL